MRRLLCLYRIREDKKNMEKKIDNKNNLLKAYIPKLDELSNEELYKLMNYVQKEISRRHKEDLMED